MANTCVNIIKMMFSDSTTEADFNNLVEHLTGDNSGFFEVEITWECEEFTGIEFEAQSNWSAPQDFLNALFEQYPFLKQTIGVAYEWGCLYVHSFDLQNNIIRRYDLFYCTVQFNDDNSIIKDLLFYEYNNEIEDDGNVCDEDVFYYGMSYRQALSEIDVKGAEFTILSVKPYK